MLMKIPKKMLPYSNKLLFDPNMMISETGATYDTTPDNTGFVDLKDTTKEDYLQAASGENMISTKVGVFSVVQCKRYGEEGQGLTLKIMTLIPSVNFILFSLTKRQKEWWKLHGNDKAILITKGPGRWWLT